MAPPTRAIIFDGDDTLWGIQSFYDEAKETFFTLMESSGFPRDEVSAKLAEVDSANVSHLGFSRKRFPLSMQQVYTFYAQQKGLSVNERTLRKVQNIGSSVFDRKPVLMDGAREVLSQLRDAYELYLYSGGDIEIQMEKVSNLELASYFNAIHLVDRKTTAQLDAILAEHNLHPDDTWMVGNSIRSDVNPALQLGLRAIHLHSSSWEYDAEDITAGRVWHAAKLIDIPTIVSGVDNINFASR